MALEASVRRLGRRFSRLRWMTKVRVLRRYDPRSWSKPFQSLRYVLWDPELDNFSYGLANHAELATALATVLHVEPALVSAYIDEVESDLELRAELGGAARWRPEAKARLRYGRRVLWYAAARLRRPAVVVEAGMKDGLGSALLLHALDRNAAEGADGILLSFDLSPDRGWLVPTRWRGRWEPIFRSTTEALPTCLEGRLVGLVIHDSAPSLEVELHELGCAIAAADQPLVMFSNGDWSTGLQQLCAEHGGVAVAVREQPVDHFYPGSRVDIGCINA